MATTNMLAISSEHRLRSENLAFDIDVWYPSLAAFTFRSEFVPLTRTEALAIMNYQNTRYLSRNRLTAEDVLVLQSLENRIAVSLQSFPKGAFLRLCGRSPKDAEPLDRSALRQQYATALDALLAAGNPLDANTKLRAIAKCHWLKVTSAPQAMSLLLSSERVFADMRDWLEYGEPEQVVLRDWEEDLTQEFEFRAYVHRGTVTALSQYDHYCVYPQLQSMKQHLQEVILAYWQQVHPHVGVDSYTMDFAYLPQSGRVVMVELSPFLTCTGAALFSWATERDLLENGPFEFRLNHKLHPQIEHLVETNWEQRWQGDVQPYWELYDTVLTSTSSTVGTASIPDSKAAALSRRLAVGSTATVTSALTAAFCAYQHGRLSTAMLGCSLALGALAGAAHWKVASLIRQKHHREAGSVVANKAARMPDRKFVPPACDHLLFVYGTLKRGFHWNRKFLSQCEFVGAARSCERYALVVGESGVPYLLGDTAGQGHRIRGELWRVDAVSLLGLDEYEGCGKGYYSRRAIEVELEPIYSAASDASDASAVETGTCVSGAIQQADVYFKTDSSTERSSGVFSAEDFVAEYSPEMHRNQYKAIRHIQVKQEMYLAGGQAVPREALD
eukprot:TRINITY_DN13882_c0_g1_i1.p1 TRINITY_DN13882_c0_g1~~TRINITY_DN13882_c0_g1_i1.p1  ORF type:complete len:628 (+),score=112.34 TRINITY_DN13882_c0_g1_i1:40-1884(+)